ncbi:polysaccharide deacetylase [Perkinsela sp. CCAP 1560/4]|nr:polysaccharide deacetylase [Perkinsela sp. CCAP 1560/4]|eukprot:KNH08715.1 polysaccharide deacetylase [Perkinsela sp. CCAP 1560/4]
MIASYFTYSRGNDEEASAFCLGEIRALKSQDNASNADALMRLLRAGIRLVHIRQRKVIASEKESAIENILESMKHILHLTKEVVGSSNEWRALQRVCGLED